MISHWDEVEPRRREQGHIAGTWRSLTGPSSVTVGVQRITIDPGKWSTPLHLEGSEEEIFYVLDGSGVSVQREEPGSETEGYEVRSGDCLVHLALEHAHTLQAGPDGLDVLAFGQRHYAANTLLPNAGVSWLGPTWVLAGAEADHPWAREAAVGPPRFVEAPRPSRIVSVDDVPGDERAGETVARRRRDLGRAAGSERTGIKLYEAQPGKLATPPHCHSAEEEIFVVLEGEGALLLWDGAGGEPSAHPVHAGNAVARPAGTGVAHAFRGGERGLSFLAYGTREPNDIVYYPRSNKVFLRGVGLVAQLNRLDYWDGED